MDSRGRACRLRRPGGRRTRRVHAARRRALRISETDLWPQGPGPHDVVSFHLAIDLQRAALHCFRLHWARGVRGLHLAESARCLITAQSAFGDPAAWPARSERRHHARNLARHGHVRICGCAALSSDHQHRAPLEMAVGRRADYGCLGDLRGRHAFSRRAGLRFSAGRLHALDELLYRPRRGLTGDGVRLLGLLQHLLSGWRGGEARAQRPARRADFRRRWSPRSTCS